MKKSILISLGIVAALGASTSIYAYTAEQPLVTNVNESSISESTPSDLEGVVNESDFTANQLPEPVTVNIDIENASTDDIHIPLDLADRTMSQANISTASNNSIEKLVLVNETDWGTNVDKRVVYATKSGSEVTFFQVDRDPNVSIDYFKNLSIYDSSEVSVIDINGFQAVTTDEGPRKTVHIVTNDHVFTVGTVYEDVTLDYLIELAKEIKE
ncbi:hypothetical protein [Paenibacillus lactis]|uniref:DUF4367 domain-containing protein n=1 Tax=Paenibacillus lactis TaxID=228574 RepID=A0ABS4FKT9_9BACL|nr:hypothetical protein [Paenibacillus lactis]MBP1896878.1 hypothetical protein [Paenibacillus lactis]